MANRDVLINEDTLYGIASAIRDKNSTSNTYKPSQMSAAIRAIQTGTPISIATPAITFNSTTGVVTATTNQLAGLVPSGITSGTLSLAFQPAVTVTPSATSQVAVSAGRWLGGDITVGAIPSNYTSDPFYGVYKSLTNRQTLYATDSGVSSWCNTLSTISYALFLDMSLNGSFNFQNVSIIGSSAFYPPYSETGSIGNIITPGVNITSANLAFPNATIVLSDAFCDTHISSLYAPNLSYIGDRAFCNTALSELDCISIIEHIGTEAFACNSFYSLTLPKLSYMDYGAFSHNSNLTYFSASLLTYIPVFAFYQNSQLSYVNIPSCTSIGDNAFEDTALTIASFPNCSIIRGYAFHNTPISIAYFPVAQNIYYGVFNNCSLLQSVEAPQVKSIGTGAFAYTPNLIYGNFPNFSSVATYSDPFSNASFKVLSLGLITTNYSIFSSLRTTLEEIYLPSASSISLNTFINFSKLNYVSIPICQIVGNSAFANCSQLSRVDLPQCTSIGTYAFYSCIQLSQVSAPLLSIIQSSAFMYCSTLSEINLPNVLTIYNNAFLYCSNLQTVSLGNYNLERQATFLTRIFTNCSNLSRIYLYYSQAPSISKSISNYFQDQTSFYVPSSLYNTYITASYWSDVSSRFVSF